MRATEGNRRVRTWRKLGGLIAASVLALSLIGGGTTSAATPAGWGIGCGTDSSLPAGQLLTCSGASSSIVSASTATVVHTVGFFEWLRNDGPSNIAQLFVNETTSATVTGAQVTIRDNATGDQVGQVVVCPVATPLVCNIGALNARQTAYLVAAFAVPAGNANGTLKVNFNWNTTGIVLTSGKNKSHGDALSKDDSVLVAGSNNGDAAGDFNFPAAPNFQVEDAPVGGNNKQSTFLSIGGLQIGASVEDSPSLTQALCNPTLVAQIVAENPWFSCSLLTSLTSVIQVGNGKMFTDSSGNPLPLIQVRVSFKNAPSQLTGLHHFVYHYYFDATGDHAELITNDCPSGGPTSLSGPCLTVGPNNVTFWLTHNGGARM